jgi:uncharacterized C2H2 Zn-finger protein
MFKIPYLMRGKQKLNTEKNTESSLLSCKKCGMEFTEKERLKKHRKIAHSGRGERKKPSQS